MKPRLIRMLSSWSEPFHPGDEKICGECSRAFSYKAFPCPTSERIRSVVQVWKLCCQVPWLEPPCRPTSCPSSRARFSTCGCDMPTIGLRTSVRRISRTPSFIEAGSLGDVSRPELRLVLWMNRLRDSIDLDTERPMLLKKEKATPSCRPISRSLGTPCAIQRYVSISKRRTKVFMLRRYSCSREVSESDKLAIPIATRYRCLSGVSW